MAELGVELKFWGFLALESVLFFPAYVLYRAKHTLSAFSFYILLDSDCIQISLLI